ncbi:MAG: penicillin acylase family protein [Bacteriovoracaceae bacterium]|jgi:penicillin G amidase|nr:penicillin acylase family protein [Bacteriovoracaceae bacterium]
MRIVKLLSIFVIAVLVTVACIRTYFQSRLPKLSGEMQLKGLSKPVIVYRDKYSIPHIEAENRPDAMRTLGFTIAGDRLFHMDLLRRVTNGQLSEIFGPKAKKWDIVLRKLRIRKTMDDYFLKNKKNIDPKILIEVEAFYDGVQHFIETQPLPIEFLLLGYKPKPFKLEESLALTGYMVLSFAKGILSDTLFTELYANYPHDKIKELDAQLGENNNSAFNLNKNQLSDAVKIAYTKQEWFSDLSQAIKELEDEFGLFEGSNSWVVSGKKSKSGFPLFANDPHIDFSNPSVWYEAHIKTPDLDIYGNYLPLLPFPAIGHNANRAWGMTMSGTDDLDIYQEKIDWKENKVMYKNEWVPLRIEQEVIKIKGEKDYKFKVYSTPHGPLLDGTKYEKKGKHLSLKWSYSHPENHAFKALYALRDSKTKEDFEAALSLGAAPALSLTWADKAGNIGYHVMSKIPLRPEGVTGRQILNGWSGEHEYLRYLDIKENPHLYNPEDGVIVNANYKPQFKSDKYIGGYFKTSNRLERIEKLLKQQDKWSIEEFKNIQTDTISHLGPKQMAHLVPMLDSSARDEKYTKAIKYLKAWDGSSSTDSIASSIYQQWKKEILKITLRDELTPKQYKAFLSIPDSDHFFKTLVMSKTSLWWNLKATKKQETQKEIMNLSFEATLKSLETKLGSKIENWQWGKVHTLEFVHSVGKKRPLNLLFNIGPFPIAGGYGQINNLASKRYDDHFKIKSGPSTRRLIDLKDASISFGIIPTGNSGRPFSKHYDDQVKLYLNKQYRPQLLTIKDVKKSGGDVLKLIP